MIEIASGGSAPTTLEGEPLNPKSIHDWMALPLQHFLDKHPDKPREEVINEMCEIVAELVNSCGHNWSMVEPWGRFAVDSLSQAIRDKFAAHERARRNRN